VTNEIRSVVERPSAAVKCVRRRQLGDVGGGFAASLDRPITDDRT